MPSLYRYLKKQYVGSFLSGEIRFRTLAYYRDFEKDGARDDRYEGTVVFKPDGGLKGTNLTTGQPIDFGDLALHSRADSDWVYAYCLSTSLSEELFRRFGAGSCIEITDAERFIARIRKAVGKYLGTSVSKQLIAKTVDYYGHSDQLKEAWALPDRIAFKKHSSFSWQQEFRIAYPGNGAFGFENVKMSLEKVGTETGFVRQPSYGLCTYQLGSLGSICKVHEV